jgi:hypothetical protein
VSSFIEVSSSVSDKLFPSGQLFVRSITGLRSNFPAMLGYVYHSTLSLLLFERITGMVAPVPVIIGEGRILELTFPLNPC